MPHDVLRLLRTAGHGGDSFNSESRVSHARHRVLDVPPGPRQESLGRIPDTGAALRGPSGQHVERAKLCEGRSGSIDEGEQTDPPGLVTTSVGDAQRRMPLLTNGNTRALGLPGPQRIEIGQRGGLSRSP